MPATLFNQPLSPRALLLLRITPLISTTASLVYAHSENLTVSAWLQPSPRSLLPTTNKELTAVEDEAAAERIAPIWFRAFVRRGIFLVVGFNAISTWSSIGNLLVKYSPGSGGLARWEGVKKWYVVGLIAAVGHMAFVPGVMWQIKRLFDLAEGRESEEGERFAGKSALETVGSWVGVHRVRMMTVDLVAWGAFVWGVLGGLDVGV